MNEDFLDLLRALQQERARFLIVGAHALAVHGVPRATGDLDIWVQPDAANAQRVWAALRTFGAPLASIGVSVADFCSDERVVQIGVPPRRIDLLTGITGVGFDEAWGERVVRPLGTLELPFLGRETLIRNKRAAGRAKDLADLEALGAV